MDNKKWLLCNMEELMNIILSERQQILLLIYRYLSLNPSKNSTKGIHEALASKGIHLNAKSSVLYKYLNFLEKKELIKHELVGKTKHFYLKQSDQSEFNQINESDAPFLVILQKALENYSDLPLKEELDQFITKNKLINEFVIDFKAIEIESISSGINTEFLSYFYYKIIDLETVSFNYKKFEDDKSRLVELEPYLLKEHNKRWYLIGKLKGNKDFYTYPLDRIASINWEKPSIEFQRDSSFNPSKLWQDTIGIFRGKPEKVTFELKDDHMNNIDFIRTSPLHKSQKIRKLDDTWIEVELFVFPSFELIRELRKLGINNIRNLKPKVIESRL